MGGPDQENRDNMEKKEKQDKQESKDGYKPQLRPNTRISNNMFKGSLSSMNGHVFQLLEDRKARGQFRETMKALKTLASMEYKKKNVSRTTISKISGSCDREASEASAYDSKKTRTGVPRKLSTV